jgi:hypothetical protein
VAARRSKRGSRQKKAAVSGAGRVKSSNHTQPRPGTQPLWRRALGGSARWTSGLVTAAVIAAVTTVVTVLVTRHVSAATVTVRHGPPVRIDSVTVLRDPVQAGTYVFQRPLFLSPSELRSLNQFPDGVPGYDTWFRSRGGVDPFSSNVQLVVEGNANQPSRITNINLIKSCEAPLTGALFYSPSAGNEQAILIDFNLDNPRSVAQTPNGQDYFSKYTIALQPGEVQVLVISANTRRHYCQFSLQLTVLVGTHQTIETVTNDGKPFQVTAEYSSFTRYHVLYAGGVATNSGFIRENPATYNG